MIRLLRPGLAAVLMLVAATATAGEATRLVVETAGGEHAFTVEVARTDEDRARGLMFRTELAAGAGMLFIFARPAPVVMWMKNTYLPLDMLFIDGERRIVRIAAATTPLSETRIPSGGPVAAVLEVAAGVAARLGIGVGDRVRSPAFAAPP